MTEWRTIRLETCSFPTCVDLTRATTRVWRETRPVLALEWRPSTTSVRSKYTTYWIAHINLNISINLHLGVFREARTSWAQLSGSREKWWNSWASLSRKWYSCANRRLVQGRRASTFNFVVTSRTTFLSKVHLFPAFQIVQYSYSYIEQTANGHLVITGTQEMDSGNYKCVLSNPAGSTTGFVQLQVGGV